MGELVTLFAISESGSNGTLRFGNFELDLAAYELRCSGKAVRLERQAMDLLILLAKRRGEMVPRAEIVERLWGADVFVDVETGINTAIRKLRQALRDSPKSPTFIETVSGKGYRFIAHVSNVEQRDATPHRERRSSRIMLAVLPFENLSRKPEQEYFSDGLTEETISYLGQTNPESLGVIARTTSMAYKDTRKSIRDIGDELDVDYVLESSVQREDKRVRITSQLIRVNDQTHVWASHYDRELTGVLDIQRELSMEIARHVHLQLNPARLASLTQNQTRDAEAYDLYLRGLYFWNQLSPPTTKKAIEFYSRATEIDPGYALPWSGLAETYSTAPISGDAMPMEVWPCARDAAARAVAAAPDLAETQTSLGFVKFWLDWEWSAAEEAFRRAIALNPSYALAHRMLGITLSHMGVREESLAAARRARELDPLNPSHQALSAQIAFTARDFSLAVQFAQQAIAIDPEFWVGHFQLGQVYEQLGKTELAVHALNNAGRLSGGNSKAIAYRGHILAKSGRIAEAEEVLKTLDRVSRDRYVPPYTFALVHAGLGNDELALQWLERAYDAHDVHLVLLAIDPKWDRFRTQPGFEAIVEHCGFLRPSSTEL